MSATSLSADDPGMVHLRALVEKVRSYSPTSTVSSLSSENTARSACELDYDP